MLLWMRMFAGVSSTTRTRGAGPSRPSRLYSVSSSPAMAPHPDLRRSDDSCRGATPGASLTGATPAQTGLQGRQTKHVHDADLQSLLSGVGARLRALRLR